MRIYRQNTFFVEKKGILIKKYKTNQPSHPHTHDFIEIVFVLRGEGIHTIDGVDYPMAAGSFFVVDNEKTHSIVPLSTAEYYNIFMTVEFAKNLKLMDEDEGQKNVYDFLKTCAENPAAIYFNAETQTEIEHLCDMMYLELNSKKQLFSESMQSYVKLIMISYIRFRQKSQNATDLKLPQVALPRIIDYINKHYQEKITLQDIADKYKYNAAYFGRLFKKSYGLSLNQYIYRKRIEAASELLITTNQNISEIAINVGFSNMTHFYKEFECITGSTPREYRMEEMNRDNQSTISIKTGTNLSL